MQKRHRKLQKEEKNLYQRKKRESLERELQEIEELNKPKEAEKFCQKLNKSRKWFKQRTNVCRDVRENKLAEQRNILGKWTEFYREKFEDGGDELGEKVTLNQSENMDNPTFYRRNETSN